MEARKPQITNMHIFKILFAGLVLLSACERSNAEMQTPKDEQVLLLKDFRVISMVPDAPEISEATSVLIRNEEIIAVGSSAENNAPNNANIIEGRGRILMPGLIDMHVHVWDEAELSAYLANGVTTVRNASGMPFHLEFKKQIESGELIGPRLFTTDPILNSSGPNAQINHQIVESAEEARMAVREQNDRGYRHLKVYSNLSREAYAAILDEAKQLGMTIMGHTPEGVRDPGIPYDKPFNISFREIVDDGFVTIEHMESIV